MSAFGRRIIFRELLEQHERIDVPIIQRDYAQGRESESEIRGEFLDALQDALSKPSDDPALPLNLDFIYGSVEGNGISRFLPLDGQQRLTTLFLLHWYLAWRDERLEEFQQTLSIDGHSRFSYHVRPSSAEFFDAIVCFRPDSPPDDVVSVSDLVTDQSWYFRYWRLDPTIQSALHMLDAIHKRFAKSHGFYSRLTDTKRPSITFQLLDLEDFGLSDDLYIKMNARGKALTAFETFKARYEQELEDLFAGETRRIAEEEVSVATFFSRRMDTRWSDFFWPFRDRQTHVFDDAVMNLFRTIILVTRPVESNSFDDDILWLRDRANKSSYSEFHRRGWLDREFSKMLMVLLEAWSENNGKFSQHLPNARYFDEHGAFKRAVSAPSEFGYEDLTQLFAYALYIRNGIQEDSADSFQEWMRVAHNLSVNTVYNRPPDMRRSFEGLLRMLPHRNAILSYFASTEKPVTGFFEQQIKEEKLKAQLIVANPNWRELIDRAEAHGYFLGQIEFLLDFSDAIATAESQEVSVWDAKTHREIQDQFHDRLVKAEAMFSNKGLRDCGEFRWERALLCQGDYLLPSGLNHSFLINSQTEPTSWKRLLRGSGYKVPATRKLLRNLWQLLVGTDDLATELDRIISSSEGLEPWREAFVRTPAAIEYCGKRSIRRIEEEDNQVYLLKKTQMNGTHAELFTLCVYKNRLEALEANGSLKPLEISSYKEAIGTYSEPGFTLSFRYGKHWIEFGVEFRKGRFHIKIERFRLKEFPEIAVLLTDDLNYIEIPYHHGCACYAKSAERDAIVEAILELAKGLGSIPTQNKKDA